MRIRIRLGARALTLGALVLALGARVASADDAATEEFHRAVVFFRTGRIVECLDAFARAEPRIGNDAKFFISYAVALQAASTSAILIAGRDEPLIRSSVERMELLRRALRCLDRAEALATNDQDRAQAVFQRGRLLTFVGSPMEARDCYQRASETIREALLHVHWVDSLVATGCAPSRSKAGGDRRE